MSGSVISTPDRAETGDRVRWRWPVLLVLCAIPAGVVAFLWHSLGWFVLGVAIAALLVALVTACLFRDPARPSVPKRGLAHRPWVRREPPLQIPLLSSRCVICGRPLTNSASMRARVGSTCIKRYGPRYAWTQNPDHGRWLAEVAQAEALRAHAQWELDAKYELDLREHPARLATWEAERLSAAGLDRRARRQQALAWLVPCVATLASVGLGFVLSGLPLG